MTIQEKSNPRNARGAPAGASRWRASSAPRKAAENLEEDLEGACRLPGKSVADSTYGIESPSAGFHQPVRQIERPGSRGRDNKGARAAKLARGGSEWLGAPRLGGRVELLLNEASRNASDEEQPV